MRTLAIVCSLGLSAWPTTGNTQTPADTGKLDEGLDEPSRFGVFVRMKDQLFRSGRDFPTFCEKNGDRSRSELRAEVMATLREKAERSWRAVRETVVAENSGIRNVQRLWIVNGFFCDATPAACRALSEREEVAFLYRQRLFAQHRSRPGGKADTKLLRRTVKMWNDDSATPLRTEGLEIPWNLQRIAAPKAWETSTGKGVLIAVFDTGVVATDALVRALHRNPSEELNGKDDDGNGFVDDVFGWDFRSDHNCPLGDARGHGSMCSGIIAGRPAGKRKTMTGVAPRAKILPIRGTGYLRAYEYALTSGADIVSMSYMWVQRPLGNYRGLYRLAHEHMTAAGILSVGGAGNFARLAKWKQIALPKDIPCVVAASGILKNGKKAPASSQGPCTWAGVAFYDDYPKSAPLPKPDVTGCFGGFPVWSPLTRRPNRRWRIVEDVGGGAGLIVGPQGNSFAGPHAAGVAALMMSANPELPAWRVKQLMEQTCKDIGKKGRDSVFGAGLLQADKAVAAAKAVRASRAKRK